MFIETKKELREELENAEMRAVTHFRKLQKIEKIINKFEEQKINYVFIVDEIKKVLANNGWKKLILDWKTNLHWLYHKNKNCQGGFMENLEKELEAIYFALDNLDAVKNQLKKYKEDCDGIVKDCEGNIKELEYIANAIEIEIEEIRQEEMSENDNEIRSMNYEFEKERF